MRTKTPEEARETAARVWAACFGKAGDAAPVLVRNEADRLWVCAGILADDLRWLPEHGMQDMDAEARFTYALGLCQRRRMAELARITAHGAADEIRGRAWPETGGSY